MIELRRFAAKCSVCGWESDRFEQEFRAVRDAEWHAIKLHNPCTVRESVSFLNEDFARRIGDRIHEQ